MISPIQTRRHHHRLQIKSARVSIPLLTRAIRQALVRRTTNHSSTRSQHRLLSLKGSVQTSSRHSTLFTTRARSRLTRLSRNLHIRPIHQLIRRRRLQLQSRHRHSTRPLLRPRQMIPHLLTLVTNRASLPRGHKHNQAQRVRMVNRRATVVRATRPQMRTQPLSRQASPTHLRPIPTVRLLPRRPRVTTHNQNRPGRRLRHHKLTHAVQPRRAVRTVHQRIRVRPIRHRGVPVPLRRPTHRRHAQHQVDQVHYVLCYRCRPPGSIAVP